ncbi:MAG: hypothetical protein Q8P62_01640 [Candidatus Peregrinibacteria bacterium]|nr:hypothetical protein [Candidatus Peregrinibacteria bacterium]
MVEKHVGNIDKHAKVKVDGVPYAFVQTNRSTSPHHMGSSRGDTPLQIFRRVNETGAYVYFGEAGPQHAIDILPVDQRRERLKTRVLELLSTLPAQESK